MASQIDLLLINPGNKKETYGKLGSNLSGIEPPIWCGLTAAFIRKNGYSVKIIDGDGEDLSPEEVVQRVKEENPLLVNIVVMGTNPSASSTPKMAAVREILKLLRINVPQAKTILSGLHPSALPERTLKEEAVDFICKGESFYTILNLIKILKEGNLLNTEEIKGLYYIKDEKIISGGWGKLIQNPDDLPFTAWDLLPMDKYRAHNWHCFDNINERAPYAAMYTSFGCPFNCSYCNIHAMYDGQPGIRYRSPENVVEEIDLLVKKYNIKNLKIADELFVLNEKRVNKICDLIINEGYNLNIWAYARVDTVNKNMLKKMKKAGIKWLCYGIEAANENVREGVAKKITKEKIEEAIQMTHSSGIYVLGNFIFGLPDDNMETMKETLELAKNLKCDYANFYATMAYPGSKLYEEAETKGIKLPDTWTDYAQLSKNALPLPTKHLTSAEVLRFRDRAFKEYHSHPDYLKMIREKFGTDVEEHILDMLKYDINRKY